MNQSNIDPVEKARDLFDRAVETLATGAGHIQQRLAEAYVRGHIGEDANVDPALPPDVYALQLDLQAALTTANDSERGSAAASAGVLTDDQCIILARRILAAARTLNELNQHQAEGNPDAA